MADCNQTLRDSWNFFDDQLSPEARQGIHTHLGGCVDCLQAFDFYAELRIVVAKSAQNDEIPESLKVKIKNCFGDLFADSDPPELQSNS